jgi:hypothetical protein
MIERRRFSAAEPPHCEHASPMRPHPRRHLRYDPRNLLFLLYKTTLWGGQRRATGSHATMCGLCEVTAPRARAVQPGLPGPAGSRPARQAEAHATVWSLCVAGHRAPWAVARAGWGSTLCIDLKIHFSDLFNPRNGSKLLEFVENYRNVQKLQTKFHWNALEQLYIVGLISPIFV